MKSSYRHRDERSNLIDICEHGNLSDDVRYADSIYGLISLLGALTKD
jgi:hypothetical protein